MTNSDHSSVASSGFGEGAKAPFRGRRGVFRVILDEAEQNPAFASRLDEALGTSAERAVTSAPGAPRQARGRRSPAVLDPVSSYREGEDALRSRLHDLSLEQLRDIIAEYGMDPDKLAMKWKSTDRLIERIVEVARGRATKGDAFRA